LDGWRRIATNKARGIVNKIENRKTNVKQALWKFMIPKCKQKSKKKENASEQEGRAGGGKR